MARQSKSRITVVGTVQGTSEDGFMIPFRLSGAAIGQTPLPENFDPENSEPVKIGPYGDYWVFRHKVLHVDGYRELDEGELVVLLKHEVLKREREFDRVRREVEAFENLERIPNARRERIPEAIRLFVWQRDEGRCVLCGRRDRLEFDHIIPVAEGGSNTERNLQLLCESCNRQKGKRV